MKVMVLTPYLPHRRVGHGGGTAVRDLITWLAKRHTVLVVTLVRPGEDDLLDDVAALGVQVLGLPYLDRAAHGGDRLALAVRRLGAWGRSLRSGYPFYVEKYADATIAARIRQAVREFQPEAIQVEYLQMSLYCRYLRNWRDGLHESRPRLILNSHELGSVPRERRADRTADLLTRVLARREATAWRRLQVDASRWADATLCVTPEDQALYSAMGGRNLVTVPLGVDLTTWAADWQPGAAADGETYLFVGSFAHRPNRLAAAFLLDRVWPRLAAARPDATLVLAGRGSDDYLAARGDLAREPARRVQALGFVDDLTAHFRSCRLFLAPLPEGGGIKIKILEAMARGVPVVTTPVGAEGISGPQDGALTVAACDETFVEAVLRDAADLAGCRRRAEVARRLMETHFSWAAITERLVALYQEPQPE